MENVTIYRRDPVCDFCSASEIVVGYTIEDFTLPEFRWGSKGGFAACATCRELVETGQREALEQRAYNSFVERYGIYLPEALTTLFIRRLHGEFWSRLKKGANVHTNSSGH